VQAGQDKGWKIGGSPMEGTVEVMGGALAGYHESRTGGIDQSGGITTVHSNHQLSPKHAAPLSKGSLVSGLASLDHAVM
jgi:hypothetical protein